MTPWTVVCHLLCPWDSPGKNTRVGSHFLLHGIIPIQGSNAHFSCLLHCRQILYPLGNWERPLLKSFVCILIYRMEMTEHPQTHTYTYIFISVTHLLCWSKIVCENPLYAAVGVFLFLSLLRLFEMNWGFISFPQNACHLVIFCICKCICENVW